MLRDTASSCLVLLLKLLVKQLKSTFLSYHSAKRCVVNIARMSNDIMAMNWRCRPNTATKSKQSNVNQKVMLGFK